MYKNSIYLCEKIDVEPVCPLVLRWFQPLTKTHFALPWHIGHEWHGPLPTLRCLTSLPVLLINLKVVIGIWNPNRKFIGVDSGSPYDCYFFATNIYCFWTSEKRKKNHKLIKQKHPKKWILQLYLDFPNPHFESPWCVPCTFDFSGTVGKPRCLLVQMGSLGTHWWAKLICNHESWLKRNHFSYLSSYATTTFLCIHLLSYALFYTLILPSTPITSTLYQT